MEGFDGRIVNGVKASRKGYVSIVVLMRSDKTWYSLSPYSLTNSEGHIFENTWQFSKVYAEVPASEQRYSRYDSTVIWKWPTEKHLKVSADGTSKILPAYYKWQQSGFENPTAVRYPVGFHSRHNVEFSLWNNSRLTYIEARKNIYLPNI